MTPNQKMWAFSRDQLANSISSLSYPKEFADLLAEQLGSPKAIDRLASYIWQAHPDSVEMIVDEMVAIQEEIVAWREKKEYREAHDKYNTWLNSEERMNRDGNEACELTEGRGRTEEMRDLYIRSMSLPEPLPRDSYLNELPVVKHLAEHGIEFHKQVTFFVGENGSGKSTLIEALAVSQGFNPEGGTKNFNFSTKDSHSELCDYLRVARGVVYPNDGFFLRAESYYNVATNIEQLDEDDDFEFSHLVGGHRIIDSYGGKSLHKQSHGESFLALVENRFGGHGLYILDEPEAALSPKGIIRLIRNMDRLIRDDSQFIISTHSPMLLAFPDAEVYEIRDEGIVSVPYYQTDHYRTTVRFLQNPESAIEDILG